MVYIEQKHLEDKEALRF